MKSLNWKNFDGKMRGVKHGKASYNKNDEKISLQLKTEVILTTTSIVGAIIDYAERENLLTAFAPLPYSPLTLGYFVCS